MAEYDINTKKKKFVDLDAAGIYGATPTGGVLTTKYAKSYGNDIGIPNQSNKASPEELDTLASKLKQKSIEPLPENDSVVNSEVALEAPAAPVGAVENPAEVAKRGQVAVAKAATSGNPNEPLIPQQAKKYLDSLEGLKNQYAPSAPEHTQRTLSEAIERASDLYQNQASKNEWLEVAQILGRAGAQFAAAQSGMAHGGQYGHNMAALDPGAGIDYNARTDRAARDRAQSVNEAKDLATSDRQSTEDLNKSDQFKYGAAKDYAHEGLSTVMKARADQVVERGQDRRAAQALQADMDKDARHTADTTLQDLKIQQATAQKKLDRAMTMSNQILAEDEIDGKTVKKFNASNPGIAGDAGINLSDVSSDIDKAQDKFHFWNTDEKKAAAKKVLMDYIRPLKDDVDRIAQQKQSLSRGGKTVPTEISAASPAPVSPPQSLASTFNDAQIQNYATTHRMNPIEARKYLESTGMTYQK